jgi:Transglycosylase SLT domain
VKVLLRSAALAGALAVIPALALSGHDGSSTARHPAALVSYSMTIPPREAAEVQAVKTGQAHHAALTAFWSHNAAVAAHRRLVARERREAAAAAAAARARAEAAAARRAARHAPATHPVTLAPAVPSGGGVLSYSQLESLWVSVGGPAAVEATAAQIAECESGGNEDAYNPSGASGLWQILGAVDPGDLFSPTVNAENAVTKFRDAGDSFSPWVCQ